MPVTGPFAPGEKVLLIDGRGRRYLVRLQAGATFHFHRGMLAHDLLLGREEGSVVRSSQGERLLALRPTLADYVLKMPRGAQVIYPKDLAMVLMLLDVYPGATVVEAGAGSGALTIALLRAVGPSGRVITYEVREDFAGRARANVDEFLGPAANLEIRMGDVYDGIDEEGVDRVVLDLPEPWRAITHAARALRGGGILVCFLPTVLQVHELSEALALDSRWAEVTTIEALVRSWHVEGRSVRPDHRMVAHTGFLTSARRVQPEE